MAAQMSTPLTAAKIRGVLAERRLLKWQFANRLGVHPQRLAAILNERAPLSPEMAARIAAALEADDARRSR
jgi:plasmid maintenance system antidote protein VapI